MRARVMLGLLGACLLAGTVVAAPGLLYAPTFRTGSPRDVLVTGRPLLTRGDVDAFVDLFESAFDLALPLGPLQDLRDHVETDFEAADADARAAWLALVKEMPAMRLAARAGNAGAVRAGLRGFRRLLDERMVADPSAPAHVLLTAMLERRHQPLWPGNPPVAAGPADAYLEAVAFVVGLGRGEAVVLDEARLRRLREQLRAGLFTEPQETRAELAGFHRVWLAAKASWDRADEATRFRARWAAVLFLSKLLPEARRVEIEPGATLPAYAAAAAKVRDAIGGYDAVATAARNPAVVLVVLKMGLALTVESDDFTFTYR